MMNPMNTKQLVDLHTKDLERLADRPGWRLAGRRRSSSLRRWRLGRDARSR